MKQLLSHNSCIFLDVLWLRMSPLLSRMSFWSSRNQLGLHRLMFVKSWCSRWWLGRIRWLILRKNRRSLFSAFCQLRVIFSIRSKSRQRNGSSNSLSKHSESIMISYWGLKRRKNTLKNKESKRKSYSWNANKTIKSKTSKNSSSTKTWKQEWTISTKYGS